MAFATIDIIFASLLLILVVRCTLRGFVEEVLSVAALVLGLLCAVIFFREAAILVRSWLGPNCLPELIAFVAVFLIVFILIKILEGVISTLVERIHLGGVNRFLGFILGLIEGVLVLSLILFVITIQPLFDAGPLLDGSLFARILLPLVSSNVAASVAVLPVGQRYV